MALVATLALIGSSSSVGHAATKALNEEAKARETAYAMELATSGVVILPRLYETLATRQVPAKNGGLAPLGLGDERIILRALEYMDREAVLTHLDRENITTPDRRRAAVQFLGAAGKAPEILRMLALVRGNDSELDATMVRATRYAVASILKRDPVAFGVLQKSYPAMRPELLPVLLQAVGEAGDPAGFEFLVSVASTHAELVTLVVAQVPALGRAKDEDLEVEIRGHARAMIQEERPEQTLVAIRACASLKDDEAIPALIELLECGNEDLRIAASAALQRMTELSFGSPAAWSRWYDAERAWMAAERAKAFQLLSSADHRDVARALEAILPHPLVREEFLAVLGDLLRTRPVEIRLLVCRALEKCGSQEAIPELVGALDSESIVVGRAAWEALKTITGRDLPQEQSAWAGLAKELGYAVKGG